VNWQVSKTSTFNYNIPKDSLDVTGSGMFSQYTRAMKQMNAAFMQRADYDPNSLYIFVMNYASTPNVTGDMPRNKQFGYLFTGAVNTGNYEMPKNDILGRTIAHEVAHGMFHLKHTFDNDYRVPENSTDNLMDYAWGNALIKHQWDAIHAPGLVIGLFEKDEDAMMAGQAVKIQDLLDWIKIKNKNKVKFSDKLFLNYKTIGEQALQAKINNKDIWLYAEIFDNGIINLTHPDVRFVIDNNYHSSFYLSFQYVDKEEEAIKIWTYSYENFKELLTYLNYELSPQIKKSIIEQYKQFVHEGKNDCNKVDVIFETIPDFVLSEIPNEDKYTSLVAISQCSVSHGISTWIWGKKYDTNEHLSIINLLKGIEIFFFAQKYTQSIELFNTVFNKLNDSGRATLIEILSLSGLEFWNNEQISQAPFFLFEPQTTYFENEINEHGGIIPNTTGPRSEFDGFCEYESTNLYRVFLIDRYYKSIIPMPDMMSKDQGETVGTFEPVHTKIENVELFIPAYFAKTLSDLKIDGYRTQWINGVFSLMLIEANLTKIKLLASKSTLAKLFSETDIRNLTRVKPTGANTSYIGASQIAAYAKRTKPTVGSTIASKVDYYVNNVASRGATGEEIAELVVREMDGFVIYPCKLNASDNGFDILAIKGDLNNPTAIRIIESKPMNAGVMNLGVTIGKGTQMSDTWIQGTISQMKGGANLKNLGNVLDNNFGMIERYVITIDKEAKEIMLLKLDIF
jgi:hypothetical protein